jgi:cyanophycinase
MSLIVRLKLFIVMALLLASQTARAKGEGLLHEYYRVGSAADVVTTTQSGIVLAGGGKDVDAAFQWMCALSGGGDFLIIRARGTDAYNAYVHELCPGVNSVATLIVPDKHAALHSDVASIIAHAEAIWIAGGDQADYIRAWTETPVQRTLQALIDRGVPVGGTSAGLQILTSFVYSAEGPSGITSAQALANPRSRLVTLRRDFLNVPLLSNILGDPHFLARDRMGRNIDFLCRIHDNGWSGQPRGIEVEEGTALLIEDDGLAFVVGEGVAYFLRTPNSSRVCSQHGPLTVHNVEVYRINAAGRFYVTTWLGSGGNAYTVSSMRGMLSSTQAGGSIY